MNMQGSVSNLSIFACGSKGMATGMPECEAPQNHGAPRPFKEGDNKSNAPHVGSLAN